MFTQEAARFADIHGIPGCAGDDVNPVGGATREHSFGQGRGKMPACSMNRKVLQPAASPRKVPAVSRLFLCLGRVLTSKSLRFEGRQKCVENWFLSGFYQILIRCMIQDYERCKYFFKYRKGKQLKNTEENRKVHVLEIE